MTLPEFTKAMLYLSAGSQKMLKPQELEVYYDMLKDLAFDDFFAGIKGVLVAHVWATFPSVAELRQAAEEIASWRTPRLTSGDAWEIAWRAAGNIDLDIRGPYSRRGKTYASQADTVLSSLPAPVVRAMKAYGLRELCDAKGPDGVIRAQFMKIFEQADAREKRVALLPPSVREFLAEKRDGDLLNRAIDGIGKPLEDAK